ncbi:hypothetical protein A4X13_0g7811 [Tilletia indica]|uniref:Uncharacterized protein n=1 Tax=Tilletia indica TaxID=43049 RepID=A0A8T8SH67_9BASI|nr:hypothetical protein A4X13_0g7811 [Tilletia indica]
MTSGNSSGGSPFHAHACWKSDPELDAFPCFRVSTSEPLALRYLRSFSQQHLQTRPRNETKSYLSQHPSSIAHCRHLTLSFDKKGRKDLRAFQ